MAFRQQCVILSTVTLGRSDETNTVVTMLMVVPGDELKSLCKEFGIQESIIRVLPESTLIDQIPYW